MKLKWKYLQWMIYFLIAFAAAMVALMVVLEPGTLRAFLADADTPALLLKGYGDWYGLLTATYALITPLVVIFGGIAMVFYIKNSSNPKYEGVRIRVRLNHVIPVTELTIVLFMGGFCLFVLAASFFDMNPYTQYRSYQAEAAAIEEGRLVSMEVLFNKDYGKAGLANHGQDYPEPLNEFSVIQSDGSGSWIYILLPDSLVSILDQSHMYNEYQSVDWNREHATTYRVTYTPNHHLVTDIEIVREGTD